MGALGGPGEQVGISSGALSFCHAPCPNILKSHQTQDRYLENVYDSLFGTLTNVYVPGCA